MRESARAVNQLFEEFLFILSQLTVKNSWSSSASLIWVLYLLPVVGGLRVSPVFIKTRRLTRTIISYADIYKSPMVAALDSQVHLDYCTSHQNGFAELEVLQWCRFSSFQTVMNCRIGKCSWDITSLAASCLPSQSIKYYKGKCYDRHNQIFLAARERYYQAVWFCIIHQRKICTFLLNNEIILMISLAREFTVILHACWRVISRISISMTANVFPLVMSK